MTMVSLNSRMSSYLFRESVQICMQHTIRRPFPQHCTLQREVSIVRGGGDPVYGIPEQAGELIQSYIRQAQSPLTFWFTKIMYIDLSPLPLPQKLLQRHSNSIDVSMLQQEGKRLERVEKPCKADHFKQGRSTKERQWKLGPYLQFSDYLVNKQWIV